MSERARTVAREGDWALVAARPFSTPLSTSLWRACVSAHLPWPSRALSPLVCCEGVCGVSNSKNGGCPSTFFCVDKSLSLFFQLTQMFFIVITDYFPSSSIRQLRNGRKEPLMKVKLSKIFCFWSNAGNISRSDSALEPRQRGGEEDGRGQREGKMEGGQVAARAALACRATGTAHTRGRGRRGRCACGVRRRARQIAGESDDQ
jgi:hypothetical protein